MQVVCIRSVNPALRRARRYRFAANILTVSELFDKAAQPAQDLFLSNTVASDLLKDYFTRGKESHSSSSPTGTVGTPVPASQWCF